MKFTRAEKLRNTAYRKAEMIEEVTFKLKRTMANLAEAGETSVTVNHKSKRGLREVMFCYKEIIEKLGDAGYTMSWDFRSAAIKQGTWFLTIYWD